MRRAVEKEREQHRLEAEAASTKLEYERLQRVHYELTGQAATLQTEATLLRSHAERRREAAR